MRAWGRLLRLSLAPTAAADIAAGALFGRGAWPSGAPPVVLIASSLCVYHGGMALNDWADRTVDARLRPDRPIPSGAIRPGAALAVGLGLLAGGPLLATAADARSAAVLGFVAVLAAVYDLVGRGPWLGPLLLGACRAGNLLAGIVLGIALLQNQANEAPAYSFHRDPSRVLGLSTYLLACAWLLPALYASYVFTVSRLGRLEDTHDENAIGGQPARLLGIAVVLLILAPVAADITAPGMQPARWRETVALVVLLGVAIYAPLAETRRAFWTRKDVLRTMGICLRRLLVFTAAVALAVGGRDAWIVAGAILAGYPLSYWLRGVFPPS